MVKRLFLNLMSSSKMNNWAADIAIALPRIICGLLLAINFGSSKFGMPWTDSEQGLALFEVAGWFPEDVAQFGAPFSWAPVFFAWMGAASEAIGGVFLALGLQTRISAFLLSCTMLTAIFFQKWGGGTWGMLPAMGFLWVSVYSLVLGSGRVGLDYWLVSTFKPKPVLNVALPLLLIAVLSTACSTNNAVVGIPAQQEFVLGERADYNFRVQLKNLSDETVQIKAVSTETGKQTQGFDLAAKGEAKVFIGKNEKVLLINQNDTEVKVKAKLNKGVEGMRYQKTGGK